MTYEVGQEFYRIVDGNYPEENPWVDTFYVAKITAKGVWLSLYKHDTEPPYFKFVLNTSRRRYAYPTLEEAIDSYEKRKNWQIKHATRSLELAQSMLTKLHTVSLNNRGLLV